MKKVSFPSSVIAKTAKGDEVRALVERGSYVLCEYLDPKTLKKTSEKRKLILKPPNGEEKEYFIIPLKQRGRSLLVTPHEKKKEQMVWNIKKNKAEKV